MTERTGVRLRAGLAGALLGALIGALAAVAFLWLAGWRRPAAAAPAGSPSRTAMIHQHGAMVMPFDLARTRHVFEMTLHGGVQQVVVRSPADTAQIPLIRRHLREEAARFAAGDFSEPMHLHGAAMPGASELADGAAGLHVTYAERPDGAQITFESADPGLVTAVHRWFGAQLSDHGADAVPR